MPIDVDPKNDYAFKYLFGSEQRKDLLIHMLNAVLKPPPGQQVQSVILRNPFTEQIVLDDKVCILDIKATDQLGRHFNVEMQMTTPPALPERVTEYWAKIYGGQLERGEDYDLLQPVISICFLDGVLFPQEERCALHFQIRERQNPELLFTDHLHIHLFQLPLFGTDVVDLQDPLEKWLYFLNNAMRLEVDKLPQTLHESTYHEAVRALIMLTQSEIERERYLARERAMKDRLSFDRTMERAVQKQKEAEQKAEQAEQKAEQAEQKAEQAEQKAEQTVAHRVEDLIAQIHMCEQLLKQPTTPEAELKTKSLDELQQLVDELRNQLLG